MDLSSIHIEKIMIIIQEFGLSSLQVGGAHYPASALHRVPESHGHCSRHAIIHVLILLFICLYVLCEAYLPPE